MEINEAHLSRITTEWSLVFQAHQGRTEEVVAAQTALMLRYGGAIHRYLLASLRDPNAAEELDQEFALRFLRGDFHRVDQSKGRFRDFVKRALRNLIIDYQRRRKTRRLSLSQIAEPASRPAIEDDYDRQFLESWRDELLGHAWEKLGELQRRTGTPHHTVLRFRADHPDLRSPQIAEQLSTRLGKSVSAVWVRQALHVARDHFLGFLLAEVASTLDSPTPEHLEEELIEVGLLEFCRPALNRRREWLDRGGGQPGR